MEPEDESHKAAPSCINCLMLEAISVEKEQELVVERAHSTSLVKENEYLRACHSNEIAKKNTEIMDHRKTVRLFALVKSHENLIDTLPKKIY